MTITAEGYDDPYLNELRELQDRIKPIIAGHPPAVQGTLLADFVALWIAGHAPALREEMLADVIDLIRKLIPLQEMMLFGPDGHPMKDDGEPPATDDADVEKAKALKGGFIPVVPKPDGASDAKEEGESSP